MYRLQDRHAESLQHLKTEKLSPHKVRVIIYNVELGVFQWLYGMVSWSLYSKTRNSGFLPEGNDTSSNIRSITYNS